MACLSCGCLTPPFPSFDVMETRSNQTGPVHRRYTGPVMAVKYSSTRRRPHTPCAATPHVVRGHRPSPRVRAPSRTHRFQGSACCRCERTRAVCAMARVVHASAGRTCSPCQRGDCNGRRFGGFREADHARRVLPPLPSSEGISPRRACAHPLVRTLSKAPQVVVAREHVP